MSRFSRRNVTVEFLDNGANSIAVGPGEGNFTYDNIEENNAEVLEARDRHAHDGLFYGDDHVQAWSITIQLKNETRTDAAAARINDWIKKTGLASTHTSVDACVWAWKARVTESDGTTTVITLLPKCRGGWAWAEAKEGNTMVITGTNYLAPVIS